MSEAMKWTLKITKYEDYHLNKLGVDELKYLNAKECFAETEARRIAYETIEKLIDEYPNHDDRWLEGFESTITSPSGQEQIITANEIPEARRENLRRKRENA